MIILDESVTHHPVHIVGRVFRAPMGWSLQPGWEFIKYLPELDEGGLPVWELVEVGEHE